MPISIDGKGLITGITVFSPQTPYADVASQAYVEVGRGTVDVPN